MNVCDACDLRLPDVKEGRLQHSYLVIRTPWCTEEKVGMDGVNTVTKAKRFQSAVAWCSGTAPGYHFGLRTSSVFTEVGDFQLRQEIGCTDLAGPLSMRRNNNQIL